MGMAMLSGPKTGMVEEEEEEEWGLRDSMSHRISVGGAGDH